MQALGKVLVAAAIFGGGFIASEVAQDEKEAAQAMMGQKPTEWHAWLAEGAGKWKVTGTMMPAPDTEMPMSAVQTNTMMQGGLWQIMELKEDSGHYAGHGIAGYDTVKKQFVSVWVGSDSAEFCPATGVLSDDKKTMTSKFQMTGPGGEKIQVTEVFERKDKDTMNFQMTHTTPDGKSVKVLDLNYKRM